MNSNWNYSAKMFYSGENGQFLGQCDLEILQMSSKKYRTPLLFPFKLCALFRSHIWVQTKVTVRGAKFGSKSSIFIARVTMTMDSWTRKSIGNIFCAISSCGYHFIAMWILTGVMVQKIAWWHDDGDTVKACDGPKLFNEVFFFRDRGVAYFSIKFNVG